MKKTISLLLALVLCLSLCACGGNGGTSGTQGTSLPDATETQAPTAETTLPETTVPETTEDPEVAAQRQKDYERALNILNSTSNPDNPPSVQTAYELLSALGDYEQSQEYLSRISVLPDMLIHMEYYTVNAFDEENMQYHSYYGYTPEGKLAYGPGSVQEWTFSFYSYDSEGRLCEIKIGTTNQTRAKHTYNYENGILTGVDILYDDGYAEQHSYSDGKLVHVDGQYSACDYTYDANGNLIQEVWSFSDGMKDSVGTYAYEFDADGNVIRMTESWQNGKYITVTEYTYENGRLVKEEVQDNQDTHYYIVYTYADYYSYNGES